MTAKIPTEAYHDFVCVLFLSPKPLNMHAVFTGEHLEAQVARGGVTKLQLDSVPVNR
eukprot:CAMPEP_0168729614 /NCGR_PEP_ID=MMETSP0724-20121128/6299_1 /TAXON_ID=265536 /ORGANISM="Amphiprora sp., Strain CCMP467" /LENGTH=56 /DNA_ID=CAMNT_0008776513 /DNA_START=123 /DNA_END=293 /DNA_ORIENTATION=+